MSRTRIDAAALLLGILAATPGLVVSSSPNLSYLTGAFSLTAVLVLLAFDREGYRSVFESIAYAAVIGLCLISPVSLLLQLAGMTFDSLRHLVVWLVALVVFVAVDRARMSGRVDPPATDSFIRPTAPAYAPPQPSFAQPMYAPQPASAAYGASYSYPTAASAPAPVATSPAPVYAPPPPIPAAAPPPAIYNPPPPPPVFAPTPATPVPQPASIVPDPPTTTPEMLSPPLAAQPAPASMPNLTAPLPPVPVQQPNNALPVPAGKEAVIYVNLKDEGLNVLRSVQAEHLGRDYYRIVEEMPAGETWEFQQGQIVRCVKKKLSSGKALVATEEAPRAR